MPKAYWRGHKILEIDYKAGLCEIIFEMDAYRSPITGTGRYRVTPENIEIREEA